MDIPPPRELHSQMRQSERDRAVAEFKAAKTRLLLCTDVAGRGMDVKGLEYVVLYDFPTLEMWVHRSGRVGRAGREGVVYGFFPKTMKAVAGDVVRMLEEVRERERERGVQVPRCQCFAENSNNAMKTHNEDREGSGSTIN